MLWSARWFEDCQLIWGKILKGKYSHYCPNNSDVPIDETRVGFSLCHCFNCKCGQLMTPRHYPFGKPILQMHTNWFHCPKLRWYNFWRHDEKDFS